MTLKIGPKAKKMGRGGVLGTSSLTPSHIKDAISKHKTIRRRPQKYAWNGQCGDYIIRRWVFRGGPSIKALTQTDKRQTDLRFLSLFYHKSSHQAARITEKEVPVIP